MMSRKLLSGLRMLPVLLFLCAGPALAHDYEVDCEGFRVFDKKAINHGQTYMVLDAELFEDVNGELLETGITVRECVLVPEKFTPWEITGSWGDLDPGDYVAHFTLSQYCDDPGDSVDCEHPEGVGPCHQPQRELAFTCDGPPNVGDCGPCEGGVDSLTFKYKGKRRPRIKVKNEDGEVLFNERVRSGHEFTVSKEGGLGDVIRIFIRHRFHTLFETNCDSPIGPGLKKGKIKILSGTSVDGGELCEVEKDDDNSSDDGSSDDDSSDDGSSGDGSSDDGSGDDDSSDDGSSDDGNSDDDSS